MQGQGQDVPAPAAAAAAAAAGHRRRPRLLQHHCWRRRQLQQAAAAATAVQAFAAGPAASQSRQGFYPPQIHIELAVGCLLSPRRRYLAVALLRENVPFLSFPYVCPEPVLVK